MTSFLMVVNLANGYRIYFTYDMRQLTISKFGISVMNMELTR